MNMQKMINFHKRMTSKKVDVECSELEDYLEEVGEYINEKAEEGKRIVLERMNEKNFVMLVRELDGVVTSDMMSEGKGMFLVMSKASGELERYINTMILTTLAILVEEEVI